MIQEVYKNTTYRSQVFLFQSPIFSHTLPPNSAALSLVSWMNPLREHVFTSTDATLEKKKGGKGAKWVSHFSLAASCQHVPQKKGLLLVIKTEYKISAKLTVKPSDCQKDWRKRLVAKMTSLTYLSTLSRTLGNLFVAVPSFKPLWQFCHSYLLSVVIFWVCLKCATRK